MFIPSFMLSSSNSATKRVLLLLFASSLILACNKKDKLGTSIQPQGDRFSLYSMDTLQIIASTVTLDSVRSDEFTYTPFGALNDPELGNSGIDIYTQVLLPEDNLTFGISPKFDSAVLTLKYAADANVYGNANDVMRIRVHELMENITLDAAYYSNLSLSTGAEFADVNRNFNLTDSVFIQQGSNKYKVPPHLRIPLNSTFLQKISNASNGVFANNDAFLSWFKGIKISANAVSGSGAVANFEQRSIVSGLTIYYNDSLKKDFPFGKPSKEVPRIAGFRHGFNSKVIQSLNVKGTDTAYLKGMGGLAAKLEIPGLKDFANIAGKGEVVIHGAELRIVPQPGTVSSTYPVPNQLLLLVKDSVSSLYKAVADRFYAQNPGYHGGTYDASCGCFRFNIVRQLQQTLTEYRRSGKNLTQALYVIISTDNPFSAGRMLLNTTKQGGMKLNILYSTVQ